MKKTAFLFFLPVCLAMACFPINFTSEPSPNLNGPFRKILFVEEADEATFDIFNKLRVEIQRQMEGHTDAIRFKRLLPLKKNSAEELATVIAEFQPDAVVHVRALNIKRFKWGPMNKSVYNMTWEFALSRPTETNILWQAHAALRRDFGVDVASQEVVEGVLAKMKADGIVR